MYVDVSNYPGTTIDISYSKVGEDLVIDTPGVYGISSFNDEERIARDVILNADIVVNIVDAVHLERDLFNPADYRHRSTYGCSSQYGG